MKVPGFYSSEGVRGTGAVLTMTRGKIRVGMRWLMMDTKNEERGQEGTG
jgi:hypothetical protein